jgi:hypothetical protein
MNFRRHLTLSVFLCSFFFPGAASVAYAVDGVVLIDQNRALAGGVTAGDAPGFPVSITQPGSYRLSGNLNVPSGTSGIVIEADYVTIDLNGFRIAGAGAQLSLSGITTGGVARIGIAVRNGTITDFLDGVSLFAVNGVRSGEIQRIRAINNVVGIDSGDNAIVNENTVIGNLFFGIAAGRNSVITGNVASGNDTGMFVGPNSVATGNTLSQNHDVGLFVRCLSNVIGNTTSANPTNLKTEDAGCSFSNNVIS